MIKGYCKQLIHRGILFAGFLGLFTTGCVLGVTKVKVNHNQLDHVENKKEGNLLVRQFTDVQICWGQTLKTEYTNINQMAERNNKLIRKLF